jgi:hypothetical protein
LGTAKGKCGYPARANSPNFWDTPVAISQLAVVREM